MTDSEQPSGCLPIRRFRIVAAMFHVYATIISIILVAASVVAGLKYMNTDQFVRIQTQQTATAAYYQLLQAMDSYKIANHGALPEPQNDLSIPASELQSFMPMTVRAPVGMTWIYEATESGNYLCLYGHISKASFDGLVEIEALDQRGFVAKTCSDEQANHDYDGQVAMLFHLN